MSLFAKLLHAAASRPAIYDGIQVIAGARTVNNRLRWKLKGIALDGWLVDVGGGTGLPADWGLQPARYVCVDVDPAKLRGFRRKHPAAGAVLGDAQRLPIGDHTVDVVICKAVTHHLPDDVLPALFADIARILKRDGRLLLVDALWAPRRWRGRLLWRYDRGSHPRTAAALRDELGRNFEILDWQRFAVHHDYALAVGRPLIGHDQD